MSYRTIANDDTAVAAVAHTVDILMRVHGTQLLRDGVFNADPNGGNFLLLSDGRIGLLDFGATKRLTREERLLGAVREIVLLLSYCILQFNVDQFSRLQSCLSRRKASMRRAYLSISVPA